MEKNVDEIMQTIPAEWRSHWCDAERCACLGCVQVGNRLIMWIEETGIEYKGDPEYIQEWSISKEVYNRNKINKEEWEAWKLLQPQNNLK